MIETLISSKTRVKLLLKFFLNNSNSSYLRGLEAEFGESSNSIRLELNKLENAGLLSSNLQGNKKYFQANTKHPLYKDINSILLKFTGLDKIVDNVIGQLGALELVFVVGDLAKGLSSEVIDLVFVGEIDKIYLFDLVQKVEQKLSKKIKYVCYSSSEFSDEEFKTNHTDYLLLWSK
ncbi:MAG TPA: transcriptional regulator [Bacteroidetes bacterium]|nr:transcriptional regulator [Bacteroidota bacterium]